MVDFIHTGSNSTTRLQNNSLTTTCDGSYAYNEENRYRIIDNYGTMNIANSTLTQIISEKSDPITQAIGNSGTLELTNTAVDVHLENATSDNRSATGIHNTGTLEYNSGSIDISRGHSYGIYTDGGTTTFHTGTVNIAGSAASYGYYANSGASTILDGTITATGGNAYGIYVAKNGNVTMGVAEDSSSAGYGNENADVSITAPNIRAIGTSTGIGVEQVDGIFNYYDGRITGSTSAKPITSTKTEYHYEATFFTDDDGYNYCYLTYIRD